MANTDRQIASFFGVAVSTSYAWKGQTPVAEYTLSSDEALRQHYAKMAERYDRVAKPPRPRAIRWP